MMCCMPMCLRDCNTILVCTAQKDEDKLLKRLLNASDRERNSAKKKQAAELPAELLNTLIEKITVHEAVKGEDGSREQEVEIYYRFIGKID